MSDGHAGAQGDLVFGPERPWGRGWVATQPRAMRRASYALADDGAVWLVDPVDGPGLDDVLAALGRVVGVVQLLDRHGRDGAALAQRHEIPLLRNPLTGVPGSPFVPIPLTQRRRWREVALWWPRHRALAVPEAVGTAPYFPRPGERVGVHPALRLAPPRVLLHADPAVLLPGHGEPLEGAGVAAELHRAIRRARRDIPRWLVGLPGATRRAQEPVSQ